MDISAITPDCGCENALTVRQLSPGDFGRGEAKASVGAVQPADKSPLGPPPKRTARPGEPAKGTAHQTNADGDSATLSSKLDQLTEQERAQVEKMKQRDAEVRTHEQAHVAAAGSLFRGGPTYTYQTGPDGNDYAVGGSVQIDTSPGRTPEETIVKASRMMQAALAPAEPSGADRAIAAKAAKMLAEAQAEVAKNETSTNGSTSRQPSQSLPAVATNTTERAIDVYA